MKRGEQIKQKQGVYCGAGVKENREMSGKPKSSPISLDNGNSDDITFGNVGGPTYIGLYAKGMLVK